MADNIIDIDKAVSSLDDFLSLTQPVGNIGQAITNNLYGINHQQLKGMLPENKDVYGYTFFTRPQLNFASSNLFNLRKFYNLIVNNNTTIHRYVRNMLDPRLARHKPVTSGTNNIITSPLVDEHNAFIPILTNNIKTMSGWSDVVAPYFTSKQGVRMEQWSMIDGTVEVNESFDIDATFQNIKNEPIILMMQCWILYAASVFEGTLLPYNDYLLGNIIDYNTRIYRLVLDETKQFVQKIAATGASFPVNVPMGEFFDFSDTTKYNTQTRDINIRFKCMGATYNDPILFKEFNQTSAIFNRHILDLLNMYSPATGLPDSTLTLERIPNELLVQFNHRGYPVIDYKTNELKWYINKDSATYKKIITYLTSYGETFMPADKKKILEHDKEKEMFKRNTR